MKRQKSKFRAISAYAEDLNKFSKTFLESKPAVNDMAPKRRSKSMYTCHLCRANFERLTALKAHMLLHSSMAYRNPEFEPNYLKRQAAIDKRVREKLGVNQASTSKLLYSSTLGEIEERKGNKLHYCNICNAPYSSMSYLGSHKLLLHKNVNSLQLVRKEVEFPNPQLPRHHKIVCYSVKKPFKCSVCGAAFARKAYWLEHGYKVHGEYFEIVGSRQAKVKTERDVEVLDPAESWTLQSQETSVISKTYSKPIPRSPTHGEKLVAEESTRCWDKDVFDNSPVIVDQKPFRCAECGAIFHLQEDLNDHSSTHNEDSTYSSEGTHTNGLDCDVVVDRKPLLCAECGVIFESLADLHVHKSVHMVKSTTSSTVLESGCVTSADKLHEKIDTSLVKIEMEMLTIIQTEESTQCEEEILGF